VRVPDVMCPPRPALDAFPSDTYGCTYYVRARSGVRLRRQTAGRVHYWPFDGLHTGPGRSEMAEGFSHWSKGFAREDRDSHRHDTYSIAAWMRQAGGDGSPVDFFNPSLEGSDRKIAEIEGWILGVA
jgi:hypothetical protein